MVSLILPAILVDRAGGRRQLTAEGGTVAEVLDELQAEFPELVGLVRGNGRLSKFMNLYVNQDDVRTVSGLDTPVSDGDQITLVPAVAGG